MDWKLCSLFTLKNITASGCGLVSGQQVASGQSCHRVTFTCLLGAGGWGQLSSDTYGLGPGGPGLEL